MPWRHHRSPLRVLILSSDYSPSPWSGVGVAVERQARALAARGVEVDVALACDLRETEALTTVPGGPRVQVLDRHRFPFQPTRYHWIHLHSLRLAGLALELRRRYRIPLAYTVHGFPQLELPTGAATGWSRVQRRLLVKSDRVVFLSRSERAFGLQLEPRLERTARIVPNGVEAGRPPRIGERKPGPIVFAGRFAYSKGIRLMGEIVERFLRDDRRDFVFAGGHGDRLGAQVIRRLADRFPGSCSFPGWLDGRSLDQVFRRAAVVVIPSVYEPFGLTAVEAMRMGAPVLAADVGGLSEIVARGSGGRRLASQAAEDWVQAIRQILMDGRERARLSLRGPVYAASHFSIDRVASLLEKHVYGVTRRP